MVNHNKSYNKLLIIGNGFDMAHLLKTSYEDFKKYMSDLIRESEGLDKSEKCTNLKKIPRSTLPKIYTESGLLADFEQERKIAYWLINETAKRAHDIKWRDFEDNLGKLRFNKVIRKWGEDDFDVKCLRDSIGDIRGFFSDWINTIDLSVAQKKEPYMSLINGKSDIALSFNYTETLEYVYGMEPSNICYLHGQRETDVELQQEKSMLPFGKNNSLIVVGFGKKYLKNRKMARKKSLLLELYKDTESIISHYEYFFNRIAHDEIKEIYTWGFSFSDADMPYIKKICDVLRREDRDSKITWFIAPYGNIFKRIKEEIHFRKCIRKAGFRGKICNQDNPLTKLINSIKNTIKKIRLF